MNETRVWTKVFQLGLVTLILAINGCSADQSPDAADAPMTLAVGEQVTLTAAIADVRLAMKQWEPDALIDAAARFRLVLPKDDDEAFYRDLWRGAALFHAVLAMQIEESGKAEQRVESTNAAAVKALRSAVARRSDDSDSHAMLAVLYGLQISRKPLAGLTLGPALLDHRDAAAAAQSDNPRVRYLEGVSLLNRARNRKAVSEALDSLLAAERLFEREARSSRPLLEPGWGHAHNRMFIGEAYERLGEPAQAMTWFDKALQLSPELDRAARGYERCRTAIDNKRS